MVIYLMTSLNDKFEPGTLSEQPLYPNWDRGKVTASLIDLESVSELVARIYQIVVAARRLALIPIEVDSKSKSQQKRERTQKERNFRRTAKYFLITQMVAVLVFLSLLGGSEDTEVEGDESFDYE
ncbi:hypothetical protein R6Q57_001363 [Mikania cordata]